MNGKQPRLGTISMGHFQDQFEQGLDDLPRTALRALVRDKLAQQGVTDIELADRVVAAIMARDCDSDEIDIDLPCKLAFSAADTARIVQATTNFQEGMPDFIRAMAEEFGRRVADGCRAQWRQNEAADKQARADRRHKIAKDWGGAFSELRLLIEGCAQHGNTFNRAQLETRLKRSKLRNEALSRLHIRVCRLAEEIVLLLENGFAEGGRARWRTLLELSVTMILIAEGGDALAQRYLDHDAIDRKKALDDLDRSAADAGTEAADRELRKEIEVEAGRVLRRYGSAFRGMYGWAAGQLGLPDKPQFHNLQELAGLIASKLQYRIACFSNHASPQSLSQLLHEWDPTLHIPDVFAADFDDPAVNTAYSLIHATSTLFEEPWDLDKLIELRTLTCFRDDVETAFRSTACRIDRAERRSMDRAARRPGKPSVWQQRSY